MGRNEFSRPLPGEQHRTIGALTSQIHTVGTLPPEAYTDVTPDASVQVEPDRTNLVIDEHVESAHARIVHAAVPHKYTSGRIVYEFVFQTNRSIDGIDNDMEIGAIGINLASTNANTVAFRPNYGNETDGNIVVDAENEDPVTGSFEYPQVSDSAHYYAIVMDFDNDETSFHVDSNPFVSKGTVIDAVPDRVTHPGGSLEYGGSTFDSLQINTIGYRYVP